MAHPSTPRWSKLVSLAGAVLVMALGWWLYPTDARRVRAACDDLAQAVSVPPREPDLARAARLATFANRLSPDVVVEVEGLDGRVEGPDQVVAIVRRLSASPRGMMVTLEDLDVTIGEDRQSAEARGVATVREPAPDNEPDMTEQRRVVLRWSRSDRGWQLVHALVQDAVSLRR